MNAELHERLMRVTVDTFKRETDKLKAELAKEKDCNNALDKETFQLTHYLSELHDANSKLKKEIARREESHASAEYEWFAARAALISNGFTQTATGEWKPPLGNRPNFEGVDLIAAALALVEAQRNMFDAANKYEARPK